MPVRPKPRADTAAAISREVRGTTNTNVNRNTNVNANRNVKVNENVNVNRNTNVNPNRNVNVDVHHDYCCYHPVATAAAVATTAAMTAAVVGSVVHTLPPACAVAAVDGITYQNCGGVWYQPQYAGRPCNTLS
ncbi:MAG TPA: hypothetical protein VMN79_00380 [Casimicrobiaceae bacterium]|nr:hypothetical protein [Casimicrobiaceae bacterium]